MTTDLAGPLLACEHASWLEEVRAALEPARRADAGAWARWSALRYLQSTFPSRLDEERRLVRRFAVQLTDEQRDTLWALGELFDAFGAQLDHLVGLCHHAEQFSVVTDRILAALGIWCRAVEAGIGSLPVAALPAEARSRLVELALEPVVSGA